MNGRRQWQWPAHDSWIVKASYRFYRLLLIVCPATFRSEYGAEMARLFRDCCREAWRQGGAPAMLDLWGRALVDLAATAASARIKEGIRGPAPPSIRVAGLAGLIAGAWYVLLFLFMLSPVVTLDSDILAATVPAMWVLFFMGLLGLHLYLAHLLDWRGLQDQFGRLNLMARAVTCGGAVLLLIGGPLALHAAGSAWLWPIAFYAVFYVYGAHIGFMGYVVLGIGLLGTGWVALHTRAFGYLSWLPLLAGVLALLNAIFASLHVLQATCCPFDATAATGSNDIQIAFYLLWAVGWIFLGYRLLSRPLGYLPRESALSSIN